MFSVQTKTQSSVFKFIRFQESFRKAPLSIDNFSGLVWSEGLTGEVKLRFQIPPALCGRGLRMSRIRSVRSQPSKWVLNDASREIVRLD